MDKSFIITIDTESDNQWNISHNQSTENSKYMPRFQSLCEKYAFKPVYLVDYSMANDRQLVDYLNEKLCENKCEVGMHLHAWDTPPSYSIDNSTGARPYLMEYPQEIMEQKISAISELLRKSFVSPVVSHRAGRWATNEVYFKILDKYGYKIDCSVTPGVDWSNQIGYKCGGTNYKYANSKLHIIEGTNILEVPMTIKKVRTGFDLSSFDVRKLLKGAIKRSIWARPSICEEREISKLIDIMADSDENYIEFMMHSSEFMPGCSPYYETDHDIDNLFCTLDNIFSQIAGKGYKGRTLQELRMIYLKGQ